MDKPTTDSTMTAPKKEFDWRDGVDLKEHMDAQLEAMRRYYDAKLESISTNTILTAAQLDKRLDGMNEFRESLKDAQARFVPASECRANMERCESDIRLLRESKAMLEGKASQNSVILALLLSVAGIVIAIVGHFVK